MSEAGNDESPAGIIMRRMFHFEVSGVRDKHDGSESISMNVVAESARLAIGGFEHVHEGFEARDVRCIDRIDAVIVRDEDADDINEEDKGKMPS